LILSENGFSGQTDMDWREVLISLRIAIYGLLASAIVLTLFRAFLEGYLV